MWIIIWLMLTASAAFAVTRHVPSEYSTIQSALDAVDEGDTVLVEVGMYAEELTAPPISFVLRGNSIPQPGDYPRPVVDPSTLTNPTQRTCLTMGTEGEPLGPPPVVEDFIFRNGPPMYPRSSGTGGVQNHTGVVLRRCKFDSTYIGLLTHNAPATLEECRFVKNQRGCLLGQNAAVTATDCGFQGNSSWTLVWIGSNSTFTRCHIYDNGDVGHLLWPAGSNITIQECTIGSSSSLVYQAVFCSASDLRFIGNVFSELPLAAAIVHLFESPGTEFRGNTFRRNFSEPYPGLRHIMLSGSGTEEAPLIVEDNFFLDTDFAFAVAFQGGAHTQIRHNRFYRQAPTTVDPELELDIGHTLLRDNLFDNPGIALDATNCVDVDARWNWWGDASGPIHPANPEGQGGEIWGDPQFDPWYTDTLFFTRADERRVFLPREAKLEAYPNPFNARATLRFTVPSAQVARIELYDVTGRRVRELWAGAIAYEKEFSFSAGDLPSGVYFARASRTVDRMPLATAKLLLLR